MKKVLLLSLLTLPIFIFGKDYNILDFGAKSQEKINSTRAIQDAIDACSKTGGRVIFPAGTYATGTIYLKSNVTVHLSKGATWTAFPDESLFPFQDIVVPSRMDVVKRKAFIYAANQQNIAITGEGTISPRGDFEMFQTHIGNDPDRPFGLRLVKCKNVSIEGVKMINSAFWMLHIFCCDFVRVDGIEIYNHCNLNNDGIDIDGCHNVVVSNCVIDSEDDALCLKSEAYRGCEDIVINNCILSSFASPFKMGTGSIYGFRRITATNCVIRPSKGEENHHEFGLWGGISGIDLGNVDGGTMEDINISNFVIDSVETPISIRLGGRHNRYFEGAPKATGGITRNLKISDITGRGSGQICCAITGYTGHYVENVSFQNIQVTFRGKGTANDTSMNVPEVIGGYPVNRMFGCNLPAYGFYVRHAKNIKFDNVSLFLENSDERPAFVMEDVHQAAITNFYADHSSKSLPLIRLKNSTGITIEGESRATDIEDFILVEGEESGGIRLKNNYLIEASNTFEPEKLEARAVNETISEIQLSWESGNEKEVGLNQYIIFRDGEEIKKTRKRHFTDINVEAGEEYKYAVATLNGYGFLSGKVKCSVLAVKDKVAPVLLKSQIVDNETIRLYFSEPVEMAEVIKPGNFLFSNAVKTKEILLSQCETVVTIKTTPLEREQELTIQNIADRSANSIKKTTLSLTDKPLVGYWMAESSEGKSADLSENGNDGIIKNAVWVEGKKGKALHFSGKNSYVNCGNNKTLNLSGDMAVAVWFKLDEPKAGKYYRILSKRKIWNSPNGYELELNPSQSRINISGGARDGAQQGVIEYAFDNNWHHLVAMIKDKKALVYIDGELAGKDELVAAPSPNDIVLFLGANPNAQDNFEGALDELMLFNRALSLKEVKDLFNLIYNY